jgi:hypothetical protein
VPACVPFHTQNDLDRRGGSGYISPDLEAICIDRVGANLGVRDHVMSSGVEISPTRVRGEFRPDEGYFTSSGEAFGPRSVSLSIGPIVIGIEGLSGRQAEALGSRYHPFVVPEATGPDVRVSLRKAGVDRFLEFRGGPGGETYRLESRLSGPRLTLWSYEFAGFIEATAHRAELALTSGEGELFDRGLENFLRVLTASFILERGGFLLHASGVVRGGKAYVFFGPSGSGKTTVTDLSPDDVVLSDDLTLVIRNGGGYEAAGIPFGLAHHRVPETRASFPVASLNRLVQSAEVRREALPGARAVAEVVGSLPFVMQETRQAARAVDVVARALELLPVWRLHFRKDGDFWAVVEEL